MLLKFCFALKTESFYRKHYAKKIAWTQETQIRRHRATKNWRESQKIKSCKVFFQLFSTEKDHLANKKGFLTKGAEKTSLRIEEKSQKSVYFFKNKIQKLLLWTLKNQFLKHSRHYFVATSRKMERSLLKTHFIHRIILFTRKMQLWQHRPENFGSISNKISKFAILLKQFSPQKDAG